MKSLESEKNSKITEVRKSSKLTVLDSVEIQRLTAGLKKLRPQPKLQAYSIIVTTQTQLIRDLTCELRLNRVHTVAKTSFLSEHALYVLNILCISL